MIFGGLGTVCKLRFRNLVSLDRGLSLYRSLVWALLSFLSIKKSNLLLGDSYLVAVLKLDK